MNAFDHGHSPVGVFTSGQHYPKRKQLKLCRPDANQSILPRREPQVAFPVFKHAPNVVAGKPVFLGDGQAVIVVRLLADLEGAAAFEAVDGGHGGFPESSSSCALYIAI